MGEATRGEGDPEVKGPGVKGRGGGEVTDVEAMEVEIEPSGALHLPPK